MEHVLLLDMAIHTFDQARLITGADPVSVYCQNGIRPALGTITMPRLSAFLK